MANFWQGTAQIAVKALQEWYGANSTGLYSWDAPDGVIASEANIPAPDQVVPIIKDAGLWEPLKDTLRWWNSANAITALIDYMLATGDRTYTESVVDNTFKNGPNTWRPKPGANAGDYTAAAAAAAAQAAANLTPFGTGTDPTTVFIDNIGVRYKNFLNDFHDDEGWWALAWIRAFDLSGDQKYIKQAETIFNEMMGGWDGVCNGGIYWQKNKQDTHGLEPYKNAIANELFLAVAAAIYLRLRDQTYFDWAYNKSWKWFDNSGLIFSATKLINDSFGKVSIGSLTSYTCSNDNSQDVWTYNQGVILGALCDLFLGSNQKMYLDRAVEIADAMIRQPVQPAAQTHGNISGVISVASPGNNALILTEWNDTDPTAGVDTKQFKGIFIRNLGYLYQHRPLARYRAFILNNAETCLSRANSFNGKNQFGGTWSALFDQADFVRQTAAVDLFNATSRLPPVQNYSSMKQFLLDSGLSLPVQLGSILNGAGSLRSVMLN